MTTRRDETQNKCLAKGREIGNAQYLTILLRRLSVIHDIVKNKTNTKAKKKHQETECFFQSNLLNTFKLFIISSCHYRKTRNFIHFTQVIYKFANKTSNVMLLKCEDICKVCELTKFASIHTCVFVMYLCSLIMAQKMGPKHAALLEKQYCCVLW
jgi:hypothetical protein